MTEQNFSGNGDESQAQSTLELMKNARRWLVWKYIPPSKPDGKRGKLPYYVNGKPRSAGLVMDSPADVAQFASYQEAADRLVKGGFDGVGFALGYDDDLGRYWQGIDLDNRDLNGLGDLVNKLPSYVELSPSGNGAHCIGLGRHFSAIAAGTSGFPGIEAYSSGRFFTFTGAGVLRNDLPVDLLGWNGDKRIRLTQVEERAESHGEWDGHTDILTEDRIIQIEWGLKNYFNSDDYSDWISVMYGLRRYGDVGRQIWDSWSVASNKFDKRRQDNEWSDVKRVRGNIDWLFSILRERGCDLSALSRLGLTDTLKTESRLIRVPRLSDYRSIKPIEFLLDGQIPVGSLTIAGVRGGGKTTMLVSLASIMTGSCVGLHPMMPKVKRKVIWVTEDEDQIHRIIVAMINTGEIADPELFWDRFIMIRAKRSEPMELARALGELGEAEGLLVNVFERGEHVAQPLIILDTVAATLEIKEENSNSDVSRAVAAVRQSIPQASVWFVTHVAKGMGRTDTLREMTARGASAFESDVQGNAVLAIEDDLPDKRFLILGKKRVDVDRNEITATRLRWETETSAVWGDRKERVSYVTVEQTDQEERQEAVEEARETANERFEEAWEARIREACERVANDVSKEGFEGILVRFGSGREYPVPGRERFKWFAADNLRQACGVGSKSGKRYEEWRDRVRSCGEMISEDAAEPNKKFVVAIAKRDYEMPGVGG
jgi:nitrogen regulatory protein PII